MVYTIIYSQNGPTTYKVINVTGSTQNQTLNFTNPAPPSGGIITEIGRFALSNKGFTGSLTIPSTVISIGENAFAFNNFLGSLTIPSSVTSIGPAAFSENAFTGSLTFLIPSSVISIGENAFAFNAFTGSLTIPSSVTSIGQAAFSENAFTGSLTIPSSVTSIGQRAFAFNDFTGSLTFSIPSSVTSIGDNAFYQNKFTGSLDIPSSVTSIGQRAFSAVSSNGFFTGQLTIPSSVTSIGIEAFSRSGFTLPQKLEYLNTNSFTIITNHINQPGAGVNINILFVSPNQGEFVFQDLPNFLQGSDTGLLTNKSLITNLNDGKYTFSVSNGINTSRFSFTFTLSEPCFLSCTRLLTISNNNLLLKQSEKYVPISEIHKGDFVKGVYSGLPIKVIHCGYSPINIDMLAKYNFPRRIPKNFFAENQPEEDIYVSGGHRIIVDKFKIPAAQFQNLDKYEIKTTAEIKEITGQDKCRYYHIELENEKEGVFAEGLRVETLEKGWWEKCNFTENI